MKKTKTEYRILGRFAKDSKHHVVRGCAGDRITDISTAKIILSQIEREEAKAKKRGAHVSRCGTIGIESPYYSDYELLDLKIQSREVTEWEDIK